MAYSLLSELAGTLVLGVPQQFDNTALIRGETGNLLDDVTDKGGAARETTLAAADAGLGLDRGGFLWIINQYVFNVVFLDLEMSPWWSLVVVMGVQSRRAFHRDGRSRSCVS